MKESDNQKRWSIGLFCSCHQGLFVHPLSDILPRCGPTMMTSPNSRCLVSRSPFLCPLIPSSSWPPLWPINGYSTPTSSFSNLRTHAWFGRRDPAFAEVLLCAELGSLHHLSHLSLTIAPQGRYSIMPISQIRELRLSGTVAAQVTQLLSANLEWSPGLAGAIALPFHCFQEMSPGEPLIPHTFIAWTQSAVPLSHCRHIQPWLFLS
ncbi:hypothetical protein HJG60_008902 [Phyllostomus discolor]|uniref:Uncharacterized protein n=1 Tax=Phyllostomus discolor TaxID=89673 RepID=A0A833YZA1_9CHIR|nr:hypothetical protein HJG60_008902 [Phyllostomus discolor]